MSGFERLRRTAVCTLLLHTIFASGELAHAAVCPSTAQAGTTELLRFGHALRRENRLAEAAACYRLLSEMHPQFADGWFELGLAQQELGELAAAAAALKAGLRLQPAADGRLSAYAALLQSMGRTDEARSAYRRAIARSPADSDAHFNLGTVEELVGEHAAALASYRTALELDPPDEARVHNNIGGVLSVMGDLRASAAAYAEAVEADPGLADAWYNLGNVMFAQGSHTQAETHLQRALRLAPAHSKVSRSLRVLLQKRGEHGCTSG